MHNQEHPNHDLIDSITRLMISDNAISICSDNMLIRKFNEKEAMANQAVFEIALLNYDNKSNTSKRKNSYLLNPDYTRVINYNPNGFVRSTKVLKPNELEDVIGTRIAKAFSFSIEGSSAKEKSIIETKRMVSIVTALKTKNKFDFINAYPQYTCLKLENSLDYRISLFDPANKCNLSSTYTPGNKEIEFDLQTKYNDKGKTIKHPYFNAIVFKESIINYFTETMKMPVDTIFALFQEGSDNFKNFFDNYDKSINNKLGAMRRTWSYESNLCLGFDIKEEDILIDKDLKYINATFRKK